MTPIAWQRLEGAVVAAAAYVAVIVLDLAWWWPLALFLTFDLSMAGYAVGARAGAALYNAAHNYALPAALGAIALLADLRWMGLLALCWAFHVGADRALGYGLKLGDGFQHTHLGWIGKGAARSDQ
ncbi:DUF4260 family protein [Demequina sp. SYSU T00192]|uniref:DUF4260 family protein n=1 Tax=Demequina litoralis TaxID=3051660 RepID=A0ABT8GAN1_9MICO|nr:DUF4260 family protein [Demequina sp. SYSU T00192]MDN4476203.1 DUF4260 family protein [Demequina sp. SYSU T00192]